jgi:hypothetical protein
MWEGEEEHECQQAGSVKQVVAAHWKHPTILLLVETAALYSKVKAICELSLLNARLLLTTRSNEPYCDGTLSQFHQVQKQETEGKTATKEYL